MLPDGKGLVAMLKAYLDRGFKQNATSGVMCVASVIFKPTHYKQFVRPWNRMLDAWGASSFHATDFYTGAEEFKRDTPKRKLLFEDDSRRIPKMVGEHVARVLMVAFNPGEFDSVASPEWKAKFGTSVHSHAVQLVLIANGWWRYQYCPSQSLAYVMESGDEDEHEVSETIARMRQDEATSEITRISSFVTAGKGVARGTEAADFAAWHWNKYYLDKFLTGQEMNPRKDLRAFVYAAKGKVDYIDATGAMLKYFFSLVPPEFLHDHTEFLRSGKGR